MLDRCARPVLAALLWLLADGAAAADLWDRIGPARIGAAREQLDVPITCDDNRRCTLSAVAGETFASVPVRAVELQFAQEQLARVSVSLSERYYSMLFSFLSTQLGASDDRTFRARGGMAAAEFDAGVHLWQHDGTSLVLEQFAGKIDRSLLTYGSTAAMADMVRSKTSFPRGAHRDL